MWAQFASYSPQFEDLNSRTTEMNNELKFELCPQNSGSSVIHPVQISEGTTQRSMSGWSSLVARQAHNLKAVGSNPTSDPNFQISQNGSPGASTSDLMNQMPESSRLGCYQFLQPSHHQHPRRMYIRKSCCRILRLQAPPNRGVGVSNDVRKYQPPVQSRPIPWARPLQPEPYAKHLRRANSPVASLLHPEMGHPSWGCLVSKSS